MRRIKYLIMTACSVLVMLTGCTKNSVEAPTLVEPANSAIESMPTVRTDIYELAIYEAEVLPGLKELSFEEDGKIGEIYVSVGQMVTKDEVLIDQVSDTKTAYDNLLEQYEKTIARNQEQNKITEIDIQIAKLKGEDVSYSELELRQTKETQALNERHMKEQLATLKAQLFESAIVAPFDGQIVSIADINEGSDVSGGKSVIAIADTSKKYVSCSFLSEKVIAESHECYAIINGQKIALNYEPYSDAEKDEANVAGRKLQSRFSFADNETIAYGNHGYVYLVNNYQEAAIGVPIAALYEDEEGGTYVYTVADNSRVKTYVTIGVKGVMYAQVLSGLEEGVNVYVQN